MFEMQNRASKDHTSYCKDLCCLLDAYSIADDLTTLQ